MKIITSQVSSYNSRHVGGGGGGGGGKKKEQGVLGGK